MGQGDNLLPQDPQLAFKYKMMAARAGYDLAQLDVAHILFTNDRETQGLIWLQRAAMQGTYKALLAYGSRLQQTPQPDTDPASAEAYFLLGIDQAIKDGALKTADTPQIFELRQRMSANSIYNDFHAEPTPLTLKARAGVTAAREYAAQAGVDDHPGHRDTP